MTKFLNTTADIKIAYQEMGEGTPIIIIHGLRASKENMLPISKFLMKNYKVYCYDVRGHGESTHPIKLTWHNHIEDLYYFIKKLNIKQPTIVGHSMGSYIALSFALQYPELISKLVLIASKLEGQQSSTSRIIEQLNLDINRLSSKQINEVIEPYMYESEMMVTTKHLAKQLKSPIKLSQLDIQLANEAMCQYDVANHITKLTTPTLIIVGEFDGINDVATNRYLSEKIKNSQFVIINKAAHMIQLEQPLKVAENIHEFILKKRS